MTVDTSLTVNATREYSQTVAENTYNRTTNFDHVDVRVNGTFTEIKGDNVVKHNIKLQNVKLIVKSSSESNATTIVNKTFTDNSETYEWRATGLSVPKSAVVTVEMDLYLGSTLMRENYTVTFQGKEAFIEAIKNCDMKTGLDFRIDPQEIIEEIFYEVSYEWSLEVDDGVNKTYISLPSTLNIHTPLTTGDYTPTDKHTVDTHWTEGYLVTDPTTHIVYEFKGWKEYKYSKETDKNILDKSTITTSDDVTIYGVWVIHEVPPTKGYITIKKNFSGNYNGVLPENLHFKVTENINGKITVYEIQYSQFVNRVFELEISDEGIYTIEEHDYELPGHDFLDTSSQTRQEITVTNLGDEYEVTFNNNYKIRTGRVISESILTILKEDGETKKPLSGAKFELKNAETGELVHSTSTETNESGYISFVGMVEGKYYLREIKAPTNYESDETVYEVLVTFDHAYEYVDATTNKYILVNYYNVTVTPETDYNGENNRLHVPNYKVYGSITINKEFGASSDIKEDNLPSSVEIKVTVTGNNYEETFTLNENNNYSVTINDLELGDYTITEEVANIDDYTLTTTYSKENVTLTTENVSETITVTNTYKEIITTIDITVNKVWDLNDSKVELPESIEVGLYKNGSLVNKQDLSESNNWTFTWAGLDDKYTWTVEEITELDKFNTTTTKTGNVYTITNTYEPTYTNLTVNKKWDFNGVLFIESTPVEVGLYKDGSLVDTITLSETNNWTYTWTNLNDTYSWTVNEITELEYFTKYIEETEENVYTIHNTITALYNVSVVKKWDKNGTDIELPESIQVGLYKGTELVETVTLSDNNNWTYSWRIIFGDFSIKELNVSEDFEVSYTRENHNTRVVITNTYKTKEEPKDPVEDKEEDKDESDVPKTGDEDEIVVFLIGLAASLTLIGYNVISYKKQYN